MLHKHPLQTKACYARKIVCYMSSCNCMILARYGAIQQEKFTCTPNLSLFQVSSKSVAQLVLMSQK